MMTAYYRYGSALEAWMHKDFLKGGGMIDRPHAW